MVAFLSRLIFVILFFLVGTSVATEVPVSYPHQGSVANKKAATDRRTSSQGLQWEILPGEDIQQIARLMFPRDSAARDNFIRAIIHTNPEHFPAGTYQPVPAGTIIHIPDFKTINAYSEPSPKTSKLGTENTPHFGGSILSDKIIAALMGIFPSLDSLFLIAIVLILLIVIVMLRNSRKKFLRSTNASLLSGTAEQHQYRALLRNYNDKIDNLPKNIPRATDATMAETHLLIEQDNPQATIQLLQKQLAINPNDIPAWLHLFEFIYKSGNKQDFKKHARRFKRLGRFPDIWVQIQDLGNHLEPDEPLYFDEQKRKEKFFS